MSHSRASSAKRFLHRTLRKVFSFFPRAVRFAVYRSFVDCDPNPDKRLVLKIAETKEELEACFKLLHDAYVGSGFMRPHPSGMRVTIYHALPTTTTLCAKFDNEVVGTISLIRESVFGFPLQSIFDLHAIREKKGRIAEVSALAVHPKFRRTGGFILFPLMKFMYEYSTNFFDTRHLVIAVNPNQIEMYESLLFFERLTENLVEKYDFVNGAPAVGASLDLDLAPEILKQVYGKKPRRKNLSCDCTIVTKCRVTYSADPYLLKKLRYCSNARYSPRLENTYIDCEAQGRNGPDARLIADAQD